jgi:hypothetical protein
MNDFEPHFGLPPDPVYIAFRDGVLKANDDVTDRWRWRWSPSHKGWFTYSVQRWILDDVGVADTPAGTSFDLIKNDESAVELARADTWLPEIFARVQTGYARNQARWPGLVWTWLGGGDWRNAMDRDDPGTPRRPDGSHDEPGRHTPLNRECQQRVADVRSWIANGTITAAQGQRMIAQIVEQCTVNPLAP